MKSVTCYICSCDDMMANVIVNFLLTLLYVIAVLFLYKIVVFVYNVYIMRKKLKHIPGFTAVPYIGTLVLTRQKEEGKEKIK